MARAMCTKRIRVLQTFSISMAVVMTLLLAPASAQVEDEEGCVEVASGGCYNKEKAIRLKVIGIFTILVSSVIGVGLPLFSTLLPFLKPDRTPALVVKVFASGVILSTAFIHVLPDSWNDLTSPCLPEVPWSVFPMSTFITMVTCILTMMMDTVATAYFKKKAGLKRLQLHNHGHDANIHDDGVQAIHHVESPAPNPIVSNKDQSVDNPQEDKESQLLRYRIIAQVLEIGIIVHSVVIGLAMGVSNNPCTITPLVAAMCFHQLFEGMGLGGCILQAEYGIKMKAAMVSFFSVTTPFGIVLGIALLKVYDESSPSALIVIGVLNAISSGLLIYMALVNLLACDFTGAKLQGNIKLQFICYFAAFIGMGIMSLMAKWA